MSVSPKKEKIRLMRAKLLHAASVLFVRNGYQNTSVEEISRFVGESSNNAFFRAFGSKENALLELMPVVLNAQLGLAGKLLGERAADKVLWYALDTAVEYYATEGSEALRDLYLAVYTLPATSDLIYKMMAPRLLDIFGEYFPEYEEKDFYELDIASAGIIRGYISVKCDMYFPLKQKIQKSVEATLRLFRVPEEKIRQTVDTVLSMDITAQVRQATDEMLSGLEEDEPCK